MEISLKTSFKFKSSIYSRKYSGSPGYIKGNPILIGNEIPSVNDTSYVLYKEEGFRLRGADNQGYCYSILTSISDNTNTSSAYLI